MVTVAKRRLGATSSATTSTFECLVPSWPSQVRCSSRPLTTTRLPRAKDWSQFSPRVPQATTSMNDVDSSHSLDWRFCHLRLTATPKVAMAWPAPVKRSSGSRVMFPVMVTLLPLDMSLLSVCPFVRTGGRGSRVDSGRPGTAGDLVGEPDDLVADHLICEAQHPVDRSHHRGVGGRLDEDVVPLVVMLDLVGESAPPPVIDASQGGPLGLDQLGGPINRRPDDVLVQADVQNHHDFIRPHSGPLPPSGPGVPARGPGGSGAGC